MLRAATLALLLAPACLVTGACATACDSVMVPSNAAAQRGAAAGSVKLALAKRLRPIAPQS